MYHKPVSVGLPSPKLDTEVVINSSRSALATMVTALFDDVGGLLSAARPSFAP